MSKSKIKTNEFTGLYEFMKVKIFIRFILLVIVLIILSACSSKPEIQIQKVEVPVIKYPYIQVPNKPDLAIGNITQNTPDTLVLKYYGRSIDQLINYSKTLLGIIEAQNELSDEKNSRNNTESQK